MSWPLLRKMNHFGLPLVPSALLLWVTNFSDRFFLVKLTDTSEVGLYSVGVRIASAMVLLLTAFRTAWPAFAYSIKSDDEAKQTYAWVLTYLVVICDLDRDRADAALALARGLADGAAVRERLARRRAALVRGGRVRRLHRARDRDRPRPPHPVQLGDHGLRGRRQHRPQPDADPGLRDDGRRRSRRSPPTRSCSSAWRGGRSGSSTSRTSGAASRPPPPPASRSPSPASSSAAGLPLAIGLIVVYPLVLLPLGFYLPAERKRLRALVVRT